jgi:Peroxidase, family 2
VQSIYNIDPTFALTLSTSGIALTANTSGLLTPFTSPILGATWTLANLATHNAIEHDASLTRNDLAQGDNTNLQPALLQALLDDAPSDTLSLASLARSRARRAAESLAHGSGAPLPPQSYLLAFGEAALLLQVMGVPVDGGQDFAASKTDVRTWIAEERLPDGWRRPDLPITLAGTTLIAEKIQALAAQYGAASGTS